MAKLEAARKREMEEKVDALLRDIHVPKFFDVKQSFDPTHIPREEIPAKIQSILAPDCFASKLKPGMRIVITASSRQIANADMIIRSIADVIKAHGAQPYIIPAMGSHAGATGKGQREIIESYNITEEFCGCPIHSSMDVVKIGVTEEGTDVVIDKFAAESDGIIVFGRIKPHTAFRGPYESGIMKMMAIGLGKQAGAAVCHREGFKYMHKHVPMFGKAILANAPVLFAVATLENAYDETYRLEALRPEEIADKEPVLLKDAYAHMPRILVDSCDVLVVDEIGKNYSGDGMDPNVTGTFITPYATGGIRSQRVAVLDLSDEAHGNACNIGKADFTTWRVHNKNIWDAGIPNVLTSVITDGLKLPCPMVSDKRAIQASLRTCTEFDAENPRIVRIPNSLHLGHIMLSEAYYEEVQKIPGMEILSQPHGLPFDEEDNLTDLRGYEANKSSGVNRRTD